MKPTAEQRFLAKTDVKEDGCWEWRGAKYDNGYGVMSFNGRNTGAHRVSYALYVGPLEAGLDVMHSCDNPGCVNPAHLSLGTRKENMHDCKSKGRHAYGEALSKFTAAEIQFAINSSLPQKEVAAILGMSQSMVSTLRNGKLWKHLDLPKGKTKLHPTEDDILIMLSMSASPRKVAELIGWSPSTIHKIRTNAANAAQPA